MKKGGEKGYNEIPQVIPKFACKVMKRCATVHLVIEQICIKIDIVFSYDDGINFLLSRTAQ